MKRKKTLLLLLLALLCFNCASAGTLTVPAGTGTVREEAFAGCAGFERLILPEGLVRIEERAFAGCAFTSVYLPASLDALAPDAFDEGVEIFTGPESKAGTLLSAQGRAYSVLLLPVSLALEADNTEIRPGERMSLRVTAEPEGADLTHLTWTSSDDTVAAVGPDGAVTGLEEGTAVIRAETMAGVSAEITVDVREHRMVCRALLVANVNYNYETARWNAGDIELLKKMLKTVTAPNGEEWQVTEMYNLTADGLKEAIRTVFADTREGDISLFHISSHGDLAEEGSLAGRLKMPRRPGIPMTYVPYATLKEWMDTYIRGETVLFLEACSSGSAVTRAAGAAFCDEGYYVLTSCAYRESCWSNRGNHNFFVQWLTEGVGLSGAMPADRDGDGAVTLGELHAYVSRIGDNYAIEADDYVYYQHSKTYPENSDFVLFMRR